MQNKPPRNDRKTEAKTERQAPPLPNCHEVLRKCRQERLGHRFADDLY